MTDRRQPVVDAAPGAVTATRSGPMSVTLSGVVGAGKSSAARAVVQALREHGVAAEHVRFQELVGAGRRRSNASSNVADSAPRPQAADTRWVGYRRRRLTAVVAAGYAWRTVLFRIRVRQWAPETVLVFDRYFYDSLVHFDVQRDNTALGLLLRVIPEPTVAALLLVSEGTIRQRRGRYSEEYARQVVHAYAELPKRFPNLVVARTDNFEAVGEIASHIVASVLARRRHQHR